MKYIAFAKNIPEAKFCKEGEEEYTLIEFDIFTEVSVAIKKYIGSCLS